jgi:anti-sigma-K factor RskA
MDVHDLTAAYALDALDPVERETYEAHLGQCAHCREELASLGETATTLAFAVVSPAPPPHLRGRILAAAAIERENVVPLPMRRPWLIRATAAAASVAACAAVGLGIWASALSNSLDRARASGAGAEQAAQVLADPSSHKIALHGGSGMIAVDPTGRGVLVVERLPAAPSGRVYEAWVIPAGGAPRKAGLFDSNGAMTMVPLTENVPRGAVVAATVERAGGTDKPTQTPIFSAQT